MAITLEQAQAQLQRYIDAEIAVSQDQWGYSDEQK